MEKNSPNQVITRFSTYELDLRTGELRKQGVRIKLQEQPFRILEMLLANPGQLVTREELRSRLWSATSFVDFDHGLNKAMNKLREALGDSAESPRCIETLAKRGYRFICPVEAARLAVRPHNSEATVVNEAQAVAAISPVDATPWWQKIRWLLTSGIVALLVALGLLAILWPARQPAADTRTTRPAQEPSIAVLSFVDLSEKKDQEYFSDGLSEELIDHLAHTKDLRGMSRTSSFYFKGKQTTISEIAKMLAVSHVLEGSVRKSGSALRITAQLIRASDGTHLWSQTYDRNLKGIFKVQDEIAGTVARALKAALIPANDARSSGETNIEAYNLVLKGNYFFWRGNTGDNAKAVEFYQQALKLEPNYSLAWANLARTYIWQAATGEIPAADGGSKARAAAQRALAIDPNLARAHYALGNVFSFADYNWTTAKSEWERVVSLDPYGEDGSYARENILIAAAIKTGRLDDVLDAFLEGLVRNPVNTQRLSDLAWFQHSAGQLDESAATSRKLLELNPAYSTAQAQYGLTLLQMGKNSEALAAAENESDEASKLTALACVYWTIGQRAKSDAAIGTLETKFSHSFAYFVAQAHAWRREPDATFAWLERAYRQRDSQIEFVKIDPLLRNVHGDPRFKAVLRKMNLSE